MAKRYVLSPIIGDGSGTDPYRAEVQDVERTNSTALIPSEIDGSPKYGFAFCIVGTLALPAVLAVSNAFVFPDYVLDGRMDGMESGARTGMQQTGEAYNLDGEGLHLDLDHTDAESYRDLLTRIGGQFQAGFSLNNFDTTEPAE